MKTNRVLAALTTAFLFAASQPCHAMWFDLSATNEEIKEMGIKLRTEARGLDQAWVELEFKPEGKLKAFDRVTMEIKDKNALLTSATLKEDSSCSKDGTLVYGFWVGRSMLEKTSLSVFIAGPIEKIGGIERREDSFYHLELKDYASADLLPKSAKDNSPIHSSEIAPNATPQEVEAAKKQGAETAAQDIKAGVFRILYYGEPWSNGKPLVDDATGYRVQIVAGCSVSSCFVAEADAYNQAMRDWHAKFRPNSAPKR